MRTSAPSTRFVVTHKDCNPGGDVFGGFMMSQVDIVGSILAVQIAGGKVVTRAVKSFEFLAPSYAGNILNFYTEVENIGNTSVTIKVEVHAEDIFSCTSTLVTTATLVYVHVNKDGEPRRITQVYSPSGTLI